MKKKSKREYTSRHMHGGVGVLCGSWKVVVKKLITCKR